ncbi:dual-specificity RNA methyltransferase RlmN [Populus alba x Populus x berolinensis]|nr:dual-specificity RNA methyltransferase RlmN [Populus alba x Populus x berolinensis]
MEMSCLWTRRLLSGANSVLLVKHPAIAFSTLAATRSIQPSPLISLFPSSIRSLSTTTAACSPPLHPHSDIGNGAVNAAVAAAIPLESPKMLLKGMSYTELEKWVQSYGFRPGQAMMLWKRLYGNGIWAHHVDELQGLNKDFVKMLGEHAKFKALSLENILTASDGTRKILFRLDDGLVIETVVIPCDRGRTTVCVSSQVGCAMNCQMGLKRHLSTAEIVEQAVFAQRLLTHEVGSFTNVVFMGMGEPLQNIDSVIKAADIMVHDQGLHFSPRKVTVSTSGLVPQLKRFLHESNCALAVSLNATTDEVRNWIMPINRKYNLGLLLQTLREELGLKNSYKVLFEYVMLDGVNDSVDDAYRLIDLVQGIPCKINLIQFNPHCGSLFRPTSTEKMIKFRNILAEAKCVVFMRYSKGDDQMAACGQLGKPGAIQTPLIRVPEQFKMAVNA